jgi:hypothetical protein
LVTAAPMPLLAPVTMKTLDAMAFLLENGVKGLEFARPWMCGRNCWMMVENEVGQKMLGMIQ